MYDVQTMLLEAVEKCKGIEVCGDKDILVDYLRSCIVDNKFYTRYWLNKSLLYKLDYKFEIFNDYIDSSAKFDYAITMLSNYIKTNKSLYEYAVSIFEIEKNYVITDLVWKSKNKNIVDDEFIKNMDSVDKLLAEGDIERS